MAIQSLNYVEGQGVSIEFSDSPTENVIDVHIAVAQLPVDALLPAETDGQVLTTVDGAAVWAEAGSSPSADTQAWLPLTTVVGGVPELVWEADDNLIPTLIPI